MKKIYVLFLLFFVSQSGAIPISDFSNTCGDRAYDKIYAMFTPNQHTCNAGQYMPAGYDGCQNCLFGHTCPGGTFNFNPNVNQGINANVYTCANGYFLPANTLGCVACPTGFTCPGGTFYFNADVYQGISKDNTYTSGNANNVCAVNYAHRMYAHFTRNEHDCSSGYYLPANIDTCTICPENNLCAGGTYTFNETNNQGIETANCANGYSAPAGSAACTGNTINVRWDDGNGGILTTICTYDGALTTPTTTPTAPRGYHFTGWSFN